MGMSAPRCNHAAVAIGDYLFVLGGTDGNEALNTVERFDLLEEVWEQMAPLPTARQLLCAAVLLH